MLGLEPLHRPSVRAVCRGPLRSPEGKRQFLRARLEVEDGSYVAHPIGGAGSHLLMGMAQANAFIVLPEDVTAVADGDAVTVMMLERRVS
jgi:molybdopterin molybdotransferase